MSAYLILKLISLAIYAREDDDLMKKSLVKYSSMDLNATLSFGERTIFNRAKDLVMSDKDEFYAFVRLLLDCSDSEYDRALLDGFSQGNKEVNSSSEEFIAYYAKMISLEREA